MLGRHIRPLLAIPHIWLDSLLKKMRRLYWSTKIGPQVYVNPPFVIDGNIKNVVFGYGATINPYCLITVAKDAKVVIGDYVRLSAGAQLITHGLKIEQVDMKRDHITYGDIVLGKNVWVGANSIIIGGVEIGDNSVIAAGSFVNQNVPPNSVFAGVPARLLKSIESPSKATALEL